MVNHQTLLFRVDASVQIGTGHLMRCLALAQGWQKVGGEAVFAIATEIGAMRSRLETEKITVHQLSVTLGSIEDGEKAIALAQELGVTWLVVDGYHFDARYQQQIKNAGFKLLFIDDYGHAEHYYADLVLNQNIYADESLYPHREPYTQLLLGTRYVLLRQEFLQWQNWQREVPEIAKKILVTLGGSDPDNVTLKVIQALQQVQIKDLEVAIVVGGSNPHYEQLQKIVQQSSLSLSLKRNVTNMPELMAWADIAIAAGGSTNWELAFMGLPSIIIVLAENQKAIAQKLDELGIAINIGDRDAFSITKLASQCHSLITKIDSRVRLKHLALKLIDGKGIERLLCLLNSNILRLRPVNYSDCKLLWEWANNPQIRNASFFSKSIPWESHQKWFEDKVKDNNCSIFIALDYQNNPMGQVRFEVDIETNEAEISVSIAPEKQGCGLGSIVIKKASEEFFCRNSVNSIRALIKVNNFNSIRAFENAGFYEFSQLHKNNCPALCYKKKI